jgi:hypothetical protein
MILAPERRIRRMKRNQHPRKIFWLTMLMGRMHIPEYDA